MPMLSEIYYSENTPENREVLPVVLIHGAGGNQLYWPSEIRRLPGYRMYALDLPGHGRSEGRGLQSISGYARQVVEWLVALDMHQAVFVGHSMGSAIALTLALDYPEHVLAVGVVGGSARLRVAPEILAELASPTTLHNAVRIILEGSFSPQTDPRLVELAGKRMLETRSTVLQGDFMACENFDRLADVSKITQPTFILCGADDRMTPLRYSQFLAGAIAGSTLRIIPEAGHMVQIEKPLETAAALSEFFQTVPYHPGGTR